MSKEKQCECCHEWWYDSDVKENLCPNCYDYFKQLKRQLAIQELEKVKEWLEPKYFDYEQINYLTRIIDQQIKELSNNTFKCEICGEITPKECEGGEPNVCAGCVPT